MAKNFTNTAATFDTEKIIHNYFVDGQGYYPAAIRIKLDPTNPDIQIRRGLCVGFATLGTPQEEPFEAIEIFQALKEILGVNWKNKVKELYGNITDVAIP